MKALKWITAVAIVFATSINVNAQGKQHKQRQMPDSAQIAKRVAKMETELALNEKQIKQFEALHAEHVKEIKATQDKYEPTREQHREEMKANRDNFEKDLAEILTEEQLAKFNELKKEKRENKGKGRKGGKKGQNGKCDGTGPNN